MPNQFDFGTIGPPILFIALSFLLSHFFEDADSHRSFCEKVRAKYILQNRAPYTLLARADHKLTTEVYEDFLLLRGIRIHFGIVTFITLFGLIVSGSILAYAAVRSFCARTVPLGVFLLLLLVFMSLVCWAYYRQQQGTARRLYEFENVKLGGSDSFFEQCYAGAEAVTKPSSMLYRMGSIFINKWGSPKRKRRTF